MQRGGGQDSFCTGMAAQRHSHTSFTRYYLFPYKTTSPLPQKPKHAKQENPFPSIAVSAKPGEGEMEKLNSLVYYQTKKPSMYHSRDLCIL